MTYTIIPRTSKDGQPLLILPDDYPPYLGYYSPTEGHGGMAYSYYVRHTRRPTPAAMELARTYAKDIPNARVRLRMAWKGLTK